MRMYRSPLVSRFEVVCRNELSETMKVTQNNTVGAENLPGRWGKPTAVVGFSPAAAAAEAG